MKRFECIGCDFQTHGTIIGFATNWDATIVWCPRCGERATLVEDRERELEIAIWEARTERSLGY